MDDEDADRGRRAEGNVFRCGLHFPVEPMKRKDILRKLEERLARGEINEKTYLEIKARYDSEPEEPEESEPSQPTMPDLGEAIGAVVAQATAEAGRHAEHAGHVIGEAMRAVDFSGIGTQLSEESIKILGSGVVSGNPIKTVEFKSAGSARVQGPLEAETARIAGSCVFEADVHVEEFRSAGSTRIAGSLRAEEVETSGGLKAEEVAIDLGGTSKISTIEAEEIRVKATGGFFRIRGELTADRIEGEEIELEATTAAFVKGDEVRIGPHCHIDVVEAKELVVHSSSEVRERRTPS